MSMEEKPQLPLKAIPILRDIPCRLPDTAALFILISAGDWGGTETETETTTIIIRATALTWPCRTYHLPETIRKPSLSACPILSGRHWTVRWPFFVIALSPQCI